MFIILSNYLFNKLVFILIKAVKNVIVLSDIVFLTFIFCKDIQ